MAQVQDVHSHQAVAMIEGDNSPPSGLASHLDMASVFLYPGGNSGEYQLHHGV